MHCVRLRRLELLANYGDYEVSGAALRLGTSEIWLTISDKLTDTNIDDLRKDINVSCGILGIDSKHMLWLMKEWGERKHIFHNQIRQYISKCYWHELATQLCRDLKELPYVVPETQTAVKYERVLLIIQKEYCR